MSLAIAEPAALAAVATAASLIVTAARARAATIVVAGEPAVLVSVAPPRSIAAAIIVAHEASVLVTVAFVGARAITAAIVVVAEAAGLAAPTRGPATTRGFGMPLRVAVPATPIVVVTSTRPVAAILVVPTARPAPIVAGEAALIVAVATALLSGHGILLLLALGEV